MTESEYKAFVQSAYDGRIRVGVDRVFARQLYTDVPISAIEQATGEAPFLEKIVVWFAVLASPVAILCSTVLAAFALRWWALLVVPLAFLFWVFNRSMSVIGGASLWFLTIAVVTAAGASFFHVLPTPWMSGFLLSFLFALWCDRLLYCASTIFLRAFVLRNQRALDAFGEGITIREAR